MLRMQRIQWCHRSNSFRYSCTFAGFFFRLSTQFKKSLTISFRVEPFGLKKLARATSKSCSEIQPSSMSFFRRRISQPKVTLVKMPATESANKRAPPTPYWPRVFWSGQGLARTDFQFGPIPSRTKPISRPVSLGYTASNRKAASWTCLSRRFIAVVTGSSYH